MKYSVYTEDGVICVYLEDHELLLHITMEEAAAFSAEISNAAHRLKMQRSLQGGRREV